jgi:hypothetical protein
MKTSTALRALFHGSQPFVSVAFSPAIHGLIAEPLGAMRRRCRCGSTAIPGSATPSTSAVPCTTSSRRAPPGSSSRTTQDHPLGSFRVFDLTGFPKVREWEQQYLSPERLAKYDQSIGAYEP